MRSCYPARMYGYHANDMRLSCEGCAVIVQGYYVVIIRGMKNGYRKGINSG